MRTPAVALAGLLALSACDKDNASAEASAKASAKTPAKTPAKAPKQKTPEPPASAGKGKAKTESKSEPDSADAAAPADGGAGPNEVALTDLGLFGTAPGESTVRDSIVGHGLMVRGPDLAATVEEATKDRPKTEAEAKKDAETFSPHNYEATSLADGWAVTYDNVGGMGSNYFVQVRRTIDDKDYWCEAAVSNPAQQAKALAFCKSLRK